MPKPTKGARLGSSPAHERIILANLASQLFQHGRITTTQVRAKRMQPLAESLITKAKKGDLHNRRLVLRRITDPGVVHSLFTEIAPSFADRNGGYTRITKIGSRQGDNAPMAVIEIVTETVEESRARKKDAKPDSKKPEAKAAKAKAEAADAEAAEAETDQVEAEVETDQVETDQVETDQVETVTADAETDDDAETPEPEGVATDAAPVDEAVEESTDEDDAK